MNAIREAHRPAKEEDLPALELRCDSLQTLVTELLVKNQELRQRLALLESSKSDEIYTGTTKYSV